LPEHWVFAYGSLIWDPGFRPAEQVVATLSGWQRSFCMASIHYRGSRDAPGLVLALDAAPGAVCQGIALRLPDDKAAQIAQAIRDRELISDAYLERRLGVNLADGRAVAATTYVINRASWQYCAHAPEAQAAIIARAAGVKGLNRDYLIQTAAHLTHLGIGDPLLDDLVARVARL
jgi:glutathione-specific gamma-glutamylcyclotransferase